MLPKVATLTFTLKMPVALPYPRMLPMLLGSISPNVFPHGALSCTPVAHTLAHRPLPLRALLILFWRGCLAAGQGSYTRHLDPSDASFLAFPLTIPPRRGRRDVSMMWWTARWKSLYGRWAFVVVPVYPSHCFSLTASFSWR